MNCFSKCCNSGPFNEVHKLSFDLILYLNRNREIFFLKKEQFETSKCTTKNKWKKTQSISTMMQLQRGSTSAKWTAILFYFKIENSDYNYKIYFILWKCYFVSSHGRMTEMKSFSCNALKRKRVPKKKHTRKTGEI